MENNVIIELQKGEKLVGDGEYIILSGYLSCNMSKHLLLFLREGERVMLNDELLPKTLEYNACNTVRLLKLNGSMTDALTGERYREFEKELLSLMVERMELLTLQKKQRLVRTLLKLGKEVGVLEGENCRIPKVWSQLELANYINCTREYLLCQKRILKEEGVILDSYQWVLMDWDKWVGKELSHSI
ncbi:Crp/Fnr family transcriptional regulator [Listeria weihenstephanensis]|uniref:Crp/Fnr family transcriptional regulator n=1 Tax=Listeria weihenstephanensis TaxID=1006155 RepID=A0A841ZBU6_9LIST|nr:Crp/Fnr family transcriptional regulator [Listeria weihenstephanensis]MBC1501986.1 Crp/Fnr family transcriptional regulator [Listeria weihenstephanensis]